MSRLQCERQRRSPRKNDQATPSTVLCNRDHERSPSCRLVSSPGPHGSPSAAPGRTAAPRGARHMPAAAFTGGALPGAADTRVRPADGLRSTRRSPRSLHRMRMRLMTCGVGPPVGTPARVACALMRPPLHSPRPRRYICHRTGSAPPLCCPRASLRARACRALARVVCVCVVCGFTLSDQLICRISWLFVVYY